jgi:ankyrin repeat protein
MQKRMLLMMKILGTLVLSVSLVVVVALVGGTRPNPQADTYILAAARSGDSAAVQQLLRRGLLQKGANVNIADADGNTPLILASEKDHTDVVKVLVAAGAKIDAANKEGATPLLLAATNGSAGVVEPLLKAGANVNAFIETTGNEGLTPLMIASMYGRADVVKVLLKAGAQPDAAAHSGLTALTAASMNGYVDVVQLLRAAGAKKLSPGCMNAIQRPGKNMRCIQWAPAP